MGRDQCVFHPFSRQHCASPLPRPIVKSRAGTPSSLPRPTAPRSHWVLGPPTATPSPIARAAPPPQHGCLDPTADGALWTECAMTRAPCTTNALPTRMHTSPASAEPRLLPCLPHLPPPPPTSLWR